MNPQLLYLYHILKSNLLFIFIVFFCISYSKQGYTELTISPNTHSMQEKLTIPVLEDMYVYDSKNKIVGRLNAESTSVIDISLYALNTFNLYANVLILRLPVSKRQISNKVILAQDYDILLDKNQAYATITIQNNLSAAYYVIYIRENKNKQLEIFKKTMWDSVVATIEIGDNDYDNYRANLICYRENIKTIKTRITIPDDLNFNNKKECFVCPLRYSFEQCLHKKQSGEQFVWEE